MTNWISRLFGSKLHFRIETKIVNKEIKYIMYARLHWWNKYQPYTYKEQSFNEVTNTISKFILLEEDIDITFKNILK